jgi:hypothetical protein
MDPNLFTALQSHDCSEPHAHRQNSVARGNAACTFRKYMKYIIEILLIATFCVEIMKYFSTESNIVDRLRMLGQIFNATFSAQAHARDGVASPLGNGQSFG